MPAALFLALVKLGFEGWVAIRHAGAWTREGFPSVQSPRFQELVDSPVVGTWRDKALRDGALCCVGMESHCWILLGASES